MSSGKKRVLSGIQPSGNLTIGNYIGALRQWVAEQETYDCYFCVVDLHAITVQQNPEELRRKTKEIAALYMAAGIDPDKCTIFVQSHIPAHSELSWLLTCMTPLGWLYRMTQYKDKSAKQEQDSIGAGLLNYPILMAADILLYQAHAVPVGDDQRQHLEYTRDIAQRFNHHYGETFVVPEAMIPKEGARIMGLDNPTAKMSKSEDSEYHAIFLLDEASQIKKKVMRSVTDSHKDILFSDDPERAGINNLLTIYQAFTGKSKSDTESDFRDARGYGDLKKAVVEVVNDNLGALQKRYFEILSDEMYLNKVLDSGREKAALVANQTLTDVKEKYGFLAP